MGRREVSVLAASALLGGSAIGSGGRRRRDRGRWTSRWATAEGGASNQSQAEDMPEVRRTTDIAAVKSTSSTAESNPPVPKKKPEGLEKFLTPETIEDLQTFLVSLAVALTIRWVAVEPRYIPSLSMYPTFDVGDELTVDKISKNWRSYQRRDVVVFNPPSAFFEMFGGDRQGEALIKRLVALEGDVVQVKGGKLYVNGERQEEAYTNEDAKYDFGPVTVPAGNVFVLGDNRNASLDGHVWGFLPVENIIGRATYKFWPPWHVGGVAGTAP